MVQEKRELATNRSDQSSDEITTRHR